MLKKQRKLANKQKKLENQSVADREGMDMPVGK